jgi:AraC-like DNA-binding protein
MQMLGLVQRFGGDASQVEIEVSDVAPDDRRLLEDRIGVAVRAVAKGHAVTFPLSWIGSCGDTMRVRHVAALPAYQDRPVPQSTAAAVLSIFDLHSGDFEHDLIMIADEFGVSPRVLQYSLQRERVCFRDVRRRARIDQARHLLGTTDATLADVALHVGYSDQANFHRAFVGTVGVTPGHYRDAQQSVGFSPQCGHRATTPAVAVAGAFVSAAVAQPTG